MKPQKTPSRAQASRLFEAMMYRTIVLRPEGSTADKTLLTQGWVSPTGKEAFLSGDKVPRPEQRLSEEGWQALRRYFAKTERMPR